MPFLNSTPIASQRFPQKDAVDQRGSRRFAVELSAILRVEGRAGPYLVTILDVSATGVRLSSCDVFPSGTRVKLSCRGVDVAGEIRYARPIDAHEYHIGVLVDAVLRDCQEEQRRFDLTRLFAKTPA